MNHDEPELHLDEQIHAALQVETPAEQLERLERFWRQQSRADHRRRTMGRATALAAMILVALAALWQPWRRPAPAIPQQDSLTHVEPADTEPNSQLAQHPAATAPTVENESSVSRGRPATPYEQLIFTARRQRREDAKQISAMTAVDNAVACLMRDPDTDAEQLLLSADLKPVNVETLLLRKLHRCDDQRKRAIMQLLAVHGTSQSTVPLLKLGRCAVLRQQALETIERTVGVNGLANAATQTNDASVRAAIYRRLFGNEKALPAYLSLIQNNFLRSEALAVADRVTQPMLDVLLTRLNAEDANERVAAALVLGHANGPIVTRSLVALVSDNPSCPAEAWIALMACRGPQADQFLAYATSQPQLLGPFNRARAYWARITN